MMRAVEHGPEQVKIDSTLKYHKTFGYSVKIDKCKKRKENQWIFQKKILLFSGRNYK